MKKRECIIAGCSNPEETRGLCHGCYQGARQRVLSGRTTWAELIRFGLAVSKAREKSAFAEAFDGQFPDRELNCAPALPAPPELNPDEIDMESVPKLTPEHLAIEAEEDALAAKLGIEKRGPYESDTDWDYRVAEAVVVGTPEPPPANDLGTLLELVSELPTHEQIAVKQATAIIEDAADKAEAGLPLGQLPEVPMPAWVKNEKPTTGPTLNGVPLVFEPNMGGSGKALAENGIKLNGVPLVTEPTLGTPTSRPSSELLNMDKDVHLRYPSLPTSPLVETTPIAKTLAPKPSSERAEARARAAERAAEPEAGPIEEEEWPPSAQQPETDYSYVNSGLVPNPPSDDDDLAPIPGDEE